MKLFKNILALTLALMLVMGMVACGGQDAGTTTDAGNSTEGGSSTEPPVVENTSGVQAYTVEAKFNSDTVNQWKTIYLVDEDTYVITVYALDSQDNTKVTADFYMSGSYTLEGNLMTIQPGYGYTKALNGDTPIEMPVAPDNGGFSAMYYAMIGQFDSFLLNADGTWTPNEGDAVAGEAVNAAAAEVQKYVVEAKFNSDIVNQWKTIYLLDEDTYVITVYALDSQDNTKVTADFYMAGSYTLEGETLTIQPGYGYVKALNGDTPIEMPVMPDNGGFSAMYYAMIGQFASFTLTEGTWTPVE